MIIKLFKWCSGKEFTCQCRRRKRWWFDPWIGKLSWRKEWQPTPVFLPGDSHRQRSLTGYKELDSTEHRCMDEVDIHILRWHKAVKCSPVIRKRYLPWNWSLVPKSLGTTDLHSLPLLSSPSVCSLQLSADAAEATASGVQPSSSSSRKWIGVDSSLWRPDSQWQFIPIAWSCVLTKLLSFQPRRQLQWDSHQSDPFPCTLVYKEHISKGHYLWWHPWRRPC